MVDGIRSVPHRGCGRRCDLECLRQQGLDQPVVVDRRVGSVLAFIPLSIAIIRSNSFGVAGGAALALALVLGVGALATAFVRFRADKTYDNEPTISAQPLLVVVAILLIGVALYAVMRIETKTQRMTAGAQVEVGVTEGAKGSSVAITLHATRIRAADRIFVTVTGIRRTPTARADQRLGLIKVSPDSDGSITTKYSLPFNASAFKELGITALCETPKRKIRAGCHGMSLTTKVPVPAS
jgi:hypothetical protein